MSTLAVDTITNATGASAVTIDSSGNLTTSGDVTIPTGHKIVGADSASIYAPGMQVQITQSDKVGSSNLVVNTSAYGNNKANYVHLGSTYNLTVTTKLANSWIVVDGRIGLANTNSSHGYFDMKVFTNGSDGGTAQWLSELTAPGATGNALPDGLIANHMESYAQNHIESFKVIYQPNVPAGTVLRFDPHVAAWSGGNVYINKHASAGNYNQISFTRFMATEIAQ
ncbi:MAG: hypothetical protein CMH04_00845 [Marinovum sp.]|nr:hypothetical protein [Marinovum sp.]|tara:strand:+ start:1933 stop:2607 length:675 start_codon:yes stop_codon:yes gene_type:complete